MTDTLESGTVVAHVVPGPSEPERVAAGDELTDQVGEPLVVGVLPGVGAQGRHDLVGVVLPVREEDLRGRVEEGEPGRVALTGHVIEYRRIEGTTQRVRRDKVQTPVPHPHRRARDRIEEPLQHGHHGLLSGPAAPTPWRRPGRPGQVGQVVGLGLVELERACERVENLQRHAPQVATLHPRVVLHADTGEQGHLLAAKAGHTTASTTDDTRLLRCDPVPARTQEVRHLRAVPCVRSIPHALILFVG